MSSSICTAGGRYSVSRSYLFQPKGPPLAHLKCPECKVVYHGRYALLMDSCPRCLARSREHVRLEATFDGFARPGRYAIDTHKLAVEGESQK